MTSDVLIVSGIVLAVAIYTAVKVVANMHRSERQWQQADKSKIKEWRDDDEW